MSFFWRSSSSLNGKAYYVTPTYPALFAAGAVAWETWLKRPIARGAAIAVVVVPRT